MPWGIERAGLVGGIVIILLIGLLCLYTSQRLLQVNSLYGRRNPEGEVPELCLELLGIHCHIICKLVSIFVLIGALIVYWVLMTNFFYYTVRYVFGLYFSINFLSLSSFNTLSLSSINITYSKTQSHTSIQLPTLSFLKVKYRISFIISKKYSNLDLLFSFFKPTSPLKISLNNSPMHPYMCFQYESSLFLCFLYSVENFLIYNLS